MNEGADDTSNFELPSQNRHSTWFVRLMREPLLHFLLLGGLLFALYGYVSGSQGEVADEQAIVVPAGKIEHLVALFTRTWQRPPTREELNGLVDDYVREEAAYREGLALGLDRNDTIIRRRIRQKLDFVAQDIADALEPTDEELAEYLNEHQASYRVEPRLSFRQVFFDPAKHGDDLESVVSDLAATLQGDPSIDAQEQGDRTLLGFRYEDDSQREISNLFGQEFAEALMEIESGTWTAPVRSAFGVHAAIVDQFQAGKRAQLDDVRDAVTRDWMQAQREALAEQFYQGLLEKYEVVVDWPPFAVEQP